jgi:tetratricopeptide (TPR) repeat protein
VKKLKISEIEKEIQQGYFSEELFVEFLNALKRVPANRRCQHCYTSAYHLKNKNPNGGIRLIKFGLDAFDSTWSDKMRAYQNLGGIYEACEDYESAKTAYESALNVIPDDKKEKYVPKLSMEILRAELHCSNFEYNEYICELYQSVIKADSFTSEFRSFAFYKAITEIIIAENNNNMELLKEAYSKAIIAVDGSAVTAMDRLLRRHKYKDDADATDKAIAFLKKNSI